MLTNFINLTFLLAACALLIPSLVFTLECLAAWLPLKPKSLSSGTTDKKRPNTITVLMPAHNEEAGISETIASVRAGLNPSGRVLVIADNCTDNTAQVAKAAGADVIERNAPEERGKGYALAFGLDHLKEAPPEVVVLVDADCRVEPGQLQHLANVAHELQRPAQAEYLLQPPSNPTPKSRVSGLAIVVKNHVRALGLSKVGLPCQLTGSGMAFPWEILTKAPPTGSYLVEDMLIGLELARAGHAPCFVPDVQVLSKLPVEDSSGAKQRRRWEHGHLQTIATYGVPVTIEGLTAKSRNLIAMGLDILVPPMALLLVLLAGAWVASGIVGLVGFWTLPFSLINYSLSMVVFAVFLSWIGFGRTVLPPEHLGEIPKYIAWKLPLYFSFFSKGSHQEWERTDRSDDTSNTTDTTTNATNIATTHSSPVTSASVSVKDIEETSAGAASASVLAEDLNETSAGATLAASSRPTVSSPINEDAPTTSSPSSPTDEAKSDANGELTKSANSIRP